MPGPPPIPVERKRARGNPGHQKLPDRANVVALKPLDGGADATPEHLGRAGAELWNTVSSFGSGWIGSTDQSLLLKLCEGEDRRREFLDRLAIDGHVLFTDKGYAYPHPCVGMLSTLEAQMTKWYSLLGLTPADRSRLGLAEVKAASTLEKLRKSRG